MAFQSTPPVWGATRKYRDHHGLGSLISIHAPRVGGDITGMSYRRAKREISIHAPRVGGDPFHAKPDILLDISIHAPRVGGDGRMAREVSERSHISIHAPRVGGDDKYTGLPSSR